MGDTDAAPHAPVSVSHSRRRFWRNHPAAFVGLAEMKNCCQALERPMSNVRSQTRFVAPSGNSAAKPLKRRQEASFSAKKASLFVDAATLASMSASETLRSRGSSPSATASPSEMPSPEVSGRSGSVA